MFRELTHTFTGAVSIGLAGLSFSGVGGAAAIALVVVVGAGASTGVAQAQDAAADQQASEPWYGYVAAEELSIRSGRAHEYYEIGKLREGDIVRVREVNQFGWATIAATPEIRGFVRARDVDAAPDGSSAIAIGRARIYYANHDDPIESWKSTPVEDGTVFQVLGRRETQSGEFFSIIMPEEADAYVPAEFIRPATDEEIKAWRLKRMQEEKKASGAAEAAAEAEAATSQGEDSLPAGVEAESDERDSAASRGAANGAVDESPSPPDAEDDAEANADDEPPSPPVSDPEIAEDGAPSQQRDVPEGEQPAPVPTSDDPETFDHPEDRGPASDEVGTPVHEQPQTEAADGPVNAPEPAGVDETLTVPPAANENGEVTAAPELPALTLDELEAEMERLGEGELLEAELEPLIAGYRDLLEDESTSESKQRLARARLTWLELKRDAQRFERQIEESLARARRTPEQIAIDAELSDVSALYDVVGRLASSTVYDGERRPLLYRVVDSSSGRTLAYIRPVEGLELAAHLNELVGISGTTATDDELEIKIIRPERVQALQRVTGG